MARAFSLRIVILTVLLSLNYASTDQENDMTDREKNILLLKHLKEQASPERFGNSLLKSLGFSKKSMRSFGRSLNDEAYLPLDDQDNLLINKLLQNENKCSIDMLALAIAVASEMQFAFAMGDAEGKEPAGVMDGNVRWIGSSDQCLRTKATYQEIPYENVTLLHDFNGKYCSALYTTPLFLGLVTERSYCVPDSCTETDIWGMVEGRPPFPLSKLEGVFCREPKPLSNDSHAIAATVVLSAFGALVLLATIIDYGLRVAKSKEKDCEEKTFKNGLQNGGYVEDKSTRECEGGEQQAKFAGQVTGQVESETVGTKRNMQSFQVDDTNDGNKKPNKCVQLVLSFSLYSTLPRVLSAKAPKGSFTCMNGIRFLSMSWIILGHTWQLGHFVGPTPGYYTAENFYSQFLFNNKFTQQAIQHMNLGVESFFVLSSSLVTISFMKALSRQNNMVTCRQMALYYFHRFWRLTPVYMLILMAYTCLDNIISNGPSSVPDFPEAANCRVSWWKNLLYLNNLITDKSCMGWTWYLANDFQFYVIAPLFIFFLYRWPLVGGPLLGLAWGGSIVAAGYIKTLVVQGERIDYIDYYVKPWCRFASYAIGILLGYIMFKTKCKRKIHWALVVLGWIVAGFFMMVSVYGSYGRGVNCDNCNEWSIQMDAMFYTLQRSLFAAGVCWMIYACCSGYGGMIDVILSWKGFIPLSKLCYVGYLIHPIIIYYVYYNSQRLIYIDELNMFIYYGAFLLYTCALTFVITLVFELPFLLMEAVIIPKKH